MSLEEIVAATIIIAIRNKRKKNEMKAQKKYDQWVKT